MGIANDQIEETGVSLERVGRALAALEGTPARRSRWPVFFNVFYQSVLEELGFRFKPAMGFRFNRQWASGLDIVRTGS
ncbi:hypothetical protein [Microvirga antarctica]|uniref:hypothetical protein n=1 Tax=Microvirga antarctica TaxID=2819233 RepID=UPI001B307E8F|nr:hypothetical protein [Microvirga antarctica]